MGIEQLTADILAEARKEAKETIDRGEEEKRRLISEGKKAVSETLSKSESEAKALVESQRRERIAWARLEAKKAINEAREAVLMDAMEEMYAQLSKFRKSPEYGAFLSARIEGGIKEIGVQNPVVRICKGDRKFVKNGGKAKISEDLEAMGGAIIESSDGTVRIDLTLETLFEEKRDFLRKKLYDRMFR